MISDANVIQIEVWFFGYDFSRETHFHKAVNHAIGVCDVPSNPACMAEETGHRQQVQDFFSSLIQVVTTKIQLEIDARGRPAPCILGLSKTRF